MVAIIFPSTVSRCESVTDVDNPILTCDTCNQQFNGIGKLQRHSKTCKPVILCQVFATPNLSWFARYLLNQTCPIMTGIFQTKPVLLCLVFAKPNLSYYAWYLLNKTCPIMPGICHTKPVLLCQVFAKPNLSYYAGYLPNQTCYIMPGICQTKPVLLCQVFAKPNLSCYAKYLLRFSSVKILRSNFKTFFIVIIV